MSFNSTRFSQSTLPPSSLLHHYIYYPHFIHQRSNNNHYSFLQISDSERGMGNFTSCFSAQSNSAKLIDLHRKSVRIVALPTTAAELMLEEPGHLISPANELLRDRRFSAMKADEMLTGGGVYLLIPISRVNGKASESEIAALESICDERRAKRRSSKVLPVVSCDGCDNPVKLLGEESDGRLNYRVKQWKPALEPIREGN